MSAALNSEFDAKHNNAVSWDEARSGSEVAKVEEEAVDAVSGLGVEVSFRESLASEVLIFFA